MGKKSPFKSKQSLKPGEVRKSVDLPKGDLDVLVELGKVERVQVKPYMERILMGHAEMWRDRIEDYKAALSPRNKAVKSNGK